MSESEATIRGTEAEWGDLAEDPISGPRTTAGRETNDPV